MGFEEYYNLEVQGHIGWVTLNRPERLNVMDRGFFKATWEVFGKIQEMDEVRVVIVKAEGRGFCAGTDLQSLGGLMQGVGAKERQATRRFIKELQGGLTAIEECDRPVIAAVHGYCIGGGVDFITACDIRIATKDAIFSIRETRMAIVPDLGTLQRLPYIIGHGYFRELALTGRDFGAEVAYRIGLITHVCNDRDELYQRAREIAEEIAHCPPLTVRATKEAIVFGRDNGVRAGLDYVAYMNAANIPSEDILEAVMAFKEKRAPRFKGE